MPSNTTNTSPPETVLVVIYSVVLLVGTISLSLMVRILKSSSTSIISIAILNLIFSHFIFLFTVPFRIYYYASKNWGLSDWWCRVVSAMIHIHMYMSFSFYVIILIMRMKMFYFKSEEMNSFHRIHALVASAIVWVVVLVTVPCVIFFHYGKNGNNTSNGSDKICFKFGENIDQPVKVINYIISTTIIVVALVLTALQANVLRVLHRKHHQGCTSQQDFGAQQKSMGFALIMVVCFIPYHIFRLFYLQNIESMENINEVFLSLTTFNCLDMLTFLGRRTCVGCFSGNG
ncbi:LOW QUALITY PROTEIN: probable G-protein coupled receptor 141 [Anabas testudineus]|uniref:LOW QUALITY PROTEIN: probable G-protein coupled receptor 141 n=1 Tax=Anabas testudineus TaxID=64144 RepID=UPI000E45E869|nr:LOW QUALITY PROTEIN: probable G-protein coupled receptor 141 [Anabas testudineus]